MPIFEYYCSKCKELFEEIVMNPDTEKALCPNCNDNAHVRKCMSAATIGRGTSSSLGTAGPASCSPGAFS